MEKIDENKGGKAALVDARAAAQRLKDSGVLESARKHMTFYKVEYVSASRNRPDEKKRDLRVLYKTK